MNFSLRGLGGVFAAALIAAPVTAVLPTLVAAPAHADAVDCGCPTTELGAYVRPATPVAPVLTDAETSSAHGARYRVQVDGTGSEARAVVHRNSDDATLLVLPVHATSWGFSPDQDTFVVELAGDATQEVAAFDLTAADPRAAVLDEVVTGDDAHIGFDATGRHLAYTWTDVDGGTGLILADLSGDSGPAPIRYRGVQSEAGLTDPLAGWGFSPQSTTFVLTYVARGGQEEARFVDLTRGEIIVDFPVSAADTWTFSPCGEYVGIVQPDAGGLFALLLRGSTGRIAGSLSVAGPTVGTFAAAASGPVLRAGGQTHELILAPVDLACLPVPPTDGGSGGSGGGSGTPADPGTPTPTTDPTPTPPTDPTPPSHLFVPPAPRALHARCHGHRITLTWPPVAGATGYVVQIARPGGAWRPAHATFRAPKAWHTVKIRVAAVNPAGRGTWSAVTVIHP
ncbi:MAG: fibronectin type III domain-containing protein [Nocardioides sp.]